MSVRVGRVNRAYQGKTGLQGPGRPPRLNWAYQGQSGVHVSSGPATVEQAYKDWAGLQGFEQAYQGTIMAVLPATHTVPTANWIHCTKTLSAEYSTRLQSTQSLLMQMVLMHKTASSFVTAVVPCWMMMAGFRDKTILKLIRMMFWESHAFFEMIYRFTITKTDKRHQSKNHKMFPAWNWGRRKKLAKYQQLIHSKQQHKQVVNLSIKHWWVLLTSGVIWAIRADTDSTTCNYTTKGPLWRNVAVLVVQE